jgi:hypothetical protein
VLTAILFFVAVVVSFRIDRIFYCHGKMPITAIAKHSNAFWVFLEMANTMVAPSGRFPGVAGAEGVGNSWRWRGQAP